MDTEIWRQNFA